MLPRRRVETFEVLPPQRFQQYLERYVSAAPGLATIYPGLTSPPWLDAREFPIVAALESAFDDVLAETERVDQAAFHREAEAGIERRGAWDVFILYERGRRNEANCAIVPRTIEILDAYATVKTFAGLAYFSRMQPHTHIAAHRGPTNMRVRCHLPLVVPAGDCAMRVGHETRRWLTGRCAVFDDHYEHEAWNRTDKPRLVLVVDLWHPALEAEEITLLTALQTRILAQAENLHRYWFENEQARRRS